MLASFLASERCRPPRAACCSLDGEFPCNTPDGDTACAFRDISFDRVVGTGKQFRGTVAELKCSALAPCENITMRGLSLAARDGGDGRLTCENVADVHVDRASVPSACAK